jgi:Proline-rich nuclear receptor coactivator motif
MTTPATAAAAPTAPQPKTPRGKHRYSKSAAAVNQDDDNVNSSRPRQARRQNVQPQRQPEWQDSVVAQETGYFDANGNFITSLGQNGLLDSISDSPSASNNSCKKYRRPPKAKPQGQGAPPAARPQGGRSPSRQLQNGVAPAPTDTPAKVAAYAGPTFHASPAASSLPIPKFFSKSMPSASNQPSLQARLEQEPESDQSESSPPPAQPSTAIAEPPPNEDSPLDFFFKADREERARQGTPTGGTTTPQSKPPPASVQYSNSSHWSQIYGGNQKRHSRHASGGSDRTMFMMELDGTPQRPGISPDHITVNRSVTAPSVIPQHRVVSPPGNVPMQPQPQMYSTPQYGNSMPVLSHAATEPREIISSGYRSDEQNGSPYTRARAHQHAPRSAGSTPAPKQNGPYQDGQSLHYGNKNLSPLFKAARTPAGGNNDIRRSSSLRQELSADQSPKTESYEFGPSAPAELPTNNSNDMLARLRALQPKHTPVSSNNDAAALDFLRKQVNQQGTPPPVKFDDVTPAAIRVLSSKKNPSPSPPASSGDVKSMENDLKRLLKLSGGAR